MVQSQIVYFVIVFGLFQQKFVNSMSAVVSTQRKMAFDKKNSHQSNTGSSAQTNTSNCKCPENVDLNEKNPNGNMQFNKLDSKSSFFCCTNCVSVISAPPGYQVEVIESRVQFEYDSNATLTIRNGKGNGGYALEKLDIKNDIITFLVSTVNAMTVIYNIGNTASSCRKVSYSVTATLHKLLAPSKTTHSLSSAQPFHLITNETDSFLNQYWTVTAETGKQVHLYLYGDMEKWDYVKILIIDGIDLNGKLISQVIQLSDSSNGPLNATSSSGGSLTVVLEVGLHIATPDINFLFTQLENDPSQCGTSKLVFLTSSDSPGTNIKINNHGGGTASCPAILIIYAQYYNYPGMQLNVSSLQGSMVLYGGIDYRQSSNNEIIRFSSMNDVITPMQVAGRVFVVLTSPGSVLNLNFQMIPYPDTMYCQSIGPAKGGSGAKGLMMSENFPHPNMDEIVDKYTINGNGNDIYEYSVNVLRYDLGYSGRLTIKSTVPDSDFSKTLTNNGVNTSMQFCANSFEVDYNSYGIGQKGFVLRYDVGKTCSRGLSTAWICIIAVAATVVIAFAAILLKRCKLRSQRNNANSTVQPVHYVPSQPNEGDPPPSYAEAMKHSTPTALSRSNRYEDAIILPA
uniref:CUB-like domain-containing protein n=1 Tax=Plectus sambesii TaxID=2011161 RepID=A0A914VFG7_9BILA